MTQPSPDPGRRVARPRPGRARRPPGRDRPGGRRPARRHPRRPCPGAREPHRRAHRLQRGVRPPGGHRPRDRDRAAAHRRRARAADAGRDRRDGRVRPTAVGPTAGQLDRLRGRDRLGDGGGGSRAARVPRDPGLGPAAGSGPVVVRGAGGRSAWALSGGERPAVDPMRLVRLVQRGENGYIGLNNGIMDQFASIFGEAGHALLLDCRTLEHRSIPMADDGPRAGRLPLGLAAQAGVVRLQRAPVPVRGGGGRHRRGPSPA